MPRVRPHMDAVHAVGVRTISARCLDGAWPRTDFFNFRAVVIEHEVEDRHRCLSFWSAVHHGEVGRGCDAGSRSHGSYGPVQGFRVGAMKQKYALSHWLLAILTACGPYAAGLLVIVTRNIHLLIAVGIIVCISCTAGAFFLRKKRNPEEAKPRLIIDPMLYSSEFVFTAVLIRYLFLK